MMYFPVMMLAVATLMIGVFAEPIMQTMNLIGDQLLAPEQYIEAVLGVTPGNEVEWIDQVTAPQDGAQSEGGAP